MRFTVATLFLLLSCVESTSFAEPPVPYHLNGGTWLVRDELFIAVVDSEKRCPLFVCYTVTKESQAGSGETRNFKTLVKEASLVKSDYAGSGYDIGHLAPLGSFDADPEADDVNYLENCAPQSPDLNRGPWLALETRERKLAEEFGSVRVACGTLFESKMPKLSHAKEKHTVPSGFWKRIEWAGGTEFYVFPQRCQRGDPLTRFRVGE